MDDQLFGFAFKKSNRKSHCHVYLIQVSMVFIYNLSCHGRSKDMNYEAAMGLAIQEARDAMENSQDIPVGAVILDSNFIIS